MADMPRRDTASRTIVRAASSTRLQRIWIAVLIIAGLTTAFVGPRPPVLGDALGYQRSAKTLATTGVLTYGATTSPSALRNAWIPFLSGADLPSCDPAPGYAARGTSRAVPCRGYHACAGPLGRAQGRGPRRRLDCACAVDLLSAVLASSIVSAHRDALRGITDVRCCCIREGRSRPAEPVGVRTRWICHRGGCAGPACGCCLGVACARGVRGVGKPERQASSARCGLDDGYCIDSRASLAV